ncbi:MAG: Thiamine-monophosphate kinase [Labilithrix sp.]|nr:Thiamine-monophosphate kinase [Labilithrix sp.]
MTERSRIAQLRATFGAGGQAALVGIGDDAAVLAGDERRLVWTIDAQVEGTHFTRELAGWEDVGFRSFMAAASDLAAMGAEPGHALSSLVLAPTVSDEDLAQLAAGQASAARQVGAPIVGGNLARGTETSITTTLLGHARAPVLRSGAQPGDGLWLAGPVGLAAAGLALLQANEREDEATAPCREAWLRPVARIAAGRALGGAAHAAIDVSDGLAHDAAQLGEASDVDVVLDAAAVLDAAGPALVHAARVLGRDPLDLALEGGEDYAVLAASAAALPGFVRVGHVEPRAARAKAGSVPRLWVVTAAGRMQRVPRGFDHFA